MLPLTVIQNGVTTIFLAPPSLIPIGKMAQNGAIFGSSRSGPMIMKPPIMDSTGIINVFPPKLLYKQS